MEGSGVWKLGEPHVGETNKWIAEHGGSELTGVMGSLNYLAEQYPEVDDEVEEEMDEWLCEDDEDASENE